MNKDTSRVYEKLIYVNPQFSIAENLQAIGDSGIQGDGL